LHNSDIKPELGLRMQQWKLPLTRACVLVLQEAGQSMHYREITGLLLKRGLISSRSPEVERCVYSGMSKQIRTVEGGGWFVHSGRGKYGLSQRGRSLEVWRGANAWAENISPKRSPRLDLTWPEAVTRALREAGKPLTARDVLSRIWQNGYKPQMDGASTERVVGNLLAKLARESSAGRKRHAIKRLRKGVYSVA
jgi:hypothetical protein